jgi:hypothetical protein
MGFTDIFKINSVTRRKKTVDTKGHVLLGEGGLFFKEMDEAYLQSPTATMCLLKFNEYCVPVGLLDDYQELWKKIVNDYIRYGYYILNVEYNVDGKVIGVTYRNPKHFVVKDKDDNDNASTFLNTKTETVYPTFNSNVTIVKSQFAKEGFEKYKGQIYMYNDSAMPYRITPMYSVLDWMKVENDSSTYVSKACDNAMFGNNLFVVKKSSDASEKELEVLESIKEILSSAKGVDEAAQNLLLEYEGDIDDVTKLIAKVSISNDINVDLLNTTDDKAQSKICTACYGFPQILISQSEGIFGNSGEAIATAEDLWAKTCQKEALNILDGFKEIGITTVKEAEKVPEETTALDEKTLDAQATLKGSVGGVQALLEVQASYAAQTTTFESAIAIFELIFGFTRDQAIKLLGSPEITKPVNNGSTNNTNNSPA